MLGNVNSYKQKPEGDFYALNDFIEGYAMVFTAIEGSGYDYYNTYKVTIIDKSGKEVLKKSYTINRYYPDWYNYDIYPQKGPYLCYQEPVTIKDRTYKTDSGVKYTKTFKGYASGLADPEGVLIKPSYTIGIAFGEYDQPIVLPANFQIITKQKKILTAKEIKKDTVRGAGFGVIDFSGKTFIPFEEEELVYNEKENTFSSYTRIYTASGKKLDYRGKYHKFVNGYMRVYKENGYNNKEGYSRITVYCIKPDGTSLNVTKTLGWTEKPEYEMSDFSTGGYAWVLNKQRTKYGLIDFKGKTILPFEYDKVNYDKWTLAEYGYAIVEKNGKLGLVNAKGKLVLECSYTYIGSINNNNEKLTSVLGVGNSSGKRGIVEINTGKFLLDCVYDKIGALSEYRQMRTTYFEMGVYFVEKDGKTLFVDKKGKELFSTRYIAINEAIDGLYSAEDGQRDNQGRMIIPRSLYNNVNLEIIESYTVYVKDGKVYRASANYLDMTFEYKSKAAVKAADLKAFKQKRTNEFNTAYEKALANPVIKTPRAQAPYISLTWDPDKKDYNIGEPFSSKGMKLFYYDIYGYGINITDEVVFKIDGKKIEDGYKFTEEGRFYVNLYYKGEELPYSYFAVNVKKSTIVDGKLVDGDYYIQLLGKYVSPVKSGNKYVLQLSSKKPSKPFTIKLAGEDKKQGPSYYIMYDGAYIQTSSKQGNQLTSGSSKFKWRVDIKTDFFTFRDYSDQKLIVNASGNSSKDGTQVIIWTHTDDPSNARATVTPAK